LHTDIGEYRVFYDVAEGEVVVTAVLHKRETAEFYGKETR
jgi:mRNA-degrading endonuclease RelE of RelBE toxin-antitoxin system